MYKKGFTLIELLLVLILMSMLSIYAIKEYKQSLLNGAIIELHDTVYNIIANGIIGKSDEYGNMVIGYSNGTGNPGYPNDNGCSPNSGRFDDLSTSRLYTCMEWNQRFTLNGTKLTGGGLMENYALNYAHSGDSGCSFETRQILDMNTFDVFIDCTNVAAESRVRVVSRIEDMLANLFGSRDKSDLIAEIIYRNAVDLTTTLANANAGTGDLNDGMLRARFTNRD